MTSPADLAAQGLATVELRGLYAEGRALVSLARRTPEQESRLRRIEQGLTESLRCQPCRDGIHDCKNPQTVLRTRGRRAAGAKSWRCCCLVSWGELIEQAEAGR